MTWPLVLPNDDGIRPAGPPDECFYCQRKVGREHGQECVCVLQRVRYMVHAPGEDGPAVGLWERDEPYHWTYHDCDFNKNEGSWCCDNAIDEIQWLNTEDGTIARAKAITLARAGSDSCNCSFLWFRAVETVKAGPFVRLLEESKT